MIESLVALLVRSSNGLSADQIVGLLLKFVGVESIPYLLKVI
jgi:hypothetical protein